MRALPPAPQRLHPAAGEDRRDRKPPQRKNRDGMLTPSFSAIVAEVCAKHGVSWRELVSQRRAKPLVRARHEAYWRCIAETRASYPQVARLFDRDHTTIMHGVNAHRRRGAAAREPAHAAP